MQLGKPFRTATGAQHPRPLVRSILFPIGDWRTTLERSTLHLTPEREGVATQTVRAGVGRVWLRGGRGSGRRGTGGDERQEEVSSDRRPSLRGVGIVRFHGRFAPCRPRVPGRPFPKKTMSARDAHTLAKLCASRANQDFLLGRAPAAGGNGRIVRARGLTRPPPYRGPPDRRSWCMLRAPISTQLIARSVQRDFSGKWSPGGLPCLSRREARESVVRGPRLPVVPATHLMTCAPRLPMSSRERVSARSAHPAGQTRARRAGATAPVTGRTRSARSDRARSAGR
jgi:hypothetical protein